MRFLGGDCEKQMRFGADLLQKNTMTASKRWLTKSIGMDKAVHMHETMDPHLFLSNAMPDEHNAAETSGGFTFGDLADL